MALASSGATAAFAGSLGLGYGFARHFSPAPPGPAIRAYREGFKPSRHFRQPHVILGVAVVCAPTDEEADYLASSTDLAWVRRHKNQFEPLPSPAAGATLTAGVGPVAEAGDAESSEPGADPDPAGSGR